MTSSASGRPNAFDEEMYRRSAENVRRLLRALEHFGAPDVVIDETHLVAADSVTAFGAPPTRIDLLSSISGVSFDEAVEQAKHVIIAGEPLPVIGLAALRRNKLASGRGKDRDDLRRLPSTPSGS